MSDAESAAESAAATSMGRAPSAAAVFLDKDGTLVENVPYNADPARVRLAPGAAECVRALREQGFRVIVISNQPGVALGLFAERALQDVKAEMERQLEQPLDGFFYCPHRAEARCRCRKPSPGLLLRAARRHEVKLGESWMVGDILDDVEAGRRAGCRTILVDNGNETEWKRGRAREPDFTVRTLSEAASRILEATRAAELAA